MDVPVTLNGTLAEHPDEAVASVGVAFLVKSGLLWKINSEFLWPLGLALAISPTEPDPNGGDAGVENGPIALALMASADGSPFTASAELVEERSQWWDSFLLAADPLREGIVRRLFPESEG